jgi:hypothetical protein
VIGEYLVPTVHIIPVGKQVLANRSLDTGGDRVAELVLEEAVDDGAVHVDV